LDFRLWLPHLSLDPVFRVADVKTRTAAIFLVAATFSTLAFAGFAEAALVGIYRNPLESLAQRSALIKLSGRNCARAGAKGVLRIELGKKTGSCSYRTPVVGRDLELAATERLLSGTPPAVQKRAYLGLELRAGAGAKYQMLVFPLQRKVQLVKVTPAATKYLAIAKNVKAVKGVNQANALRLRAINVTEKGPEQGDVRLKALLGSTLVAEATDEAGGELQGRASAVTAGAGSNGVGLIVSVDDVIVRVPF
jgi:hypothetical protein